jgi:hypothetical protein
MPDPAELDPRTVPLAEQLAHEAEVLDDASLPGDEVRCVIPSEGEDLATDPLQWMPYVTPAGFFYPKRGDRALLIDPVNGPEAVVAWWPKATEPDSSL